MFYEFCHLNVNGNLAFSIVEDNETYKHIPKTYYSEEKWNSRRLQSSFIKIYKTISEFSWCAMGFFSLVLLKST